jgi:fluoroquinolone transport system permease protein
MPISRITFTLFRMLIPVIITTILTWIILMVQPFYDIPIGSSLLFSLIAALIVPPYVLTVSVMSKNKMEAMVWAKVVNLAVVIPAVAFFVPKSVGWLFCLLPTHWAFQGLYNLILSENFVFEMVAAAVLLVLFTTLLVRRFSKVHFA